MFVVGHQLQLCVEWLAHRTQSNIPEQEESDVLVDVSIDREVVALVVAAVEFVPCV